MNFMDILKQKAAQNPEALNNPRAQSLISIIQSGDAQRGEEAAMNILESMGVSKEEGIQQAMQFFGMRR